MTTCVYPAKVLLFGEYTLFQGSGALVQPYKRYTASWQRGEGVHDELLAFLDFLAEAEIGRQLNLARLRHDIVQGTYLQSSIPYGYGLGSSGAFCAAIVDTYGTDALRSADLPAQKKALAELESYFHGASSGIDPLVCLRGEPLWLDPDGQLTPVSLPTLQAYQLFLVDTGQARQTEPLVRFFKESWEQTEFRERAVAQWVTPTRNAIDAYRTGDEAALWEAFTAISTYQLTALPPMVIPPVQEVWRAGLAGTDYRLKICGAGGGGFMLGIAPKSTKIAQLVPGFTTIKLN